MPLVCPARDAAPTESPYAPASQAKEGARNDAQSPFVVRVEKKPERSFREIMNDIRTWLDHCKIEPISFKPVAKADRGVGFEIGFGSVDEAHLFDQKFNFGPMLEAQIPRLRRYARALTHDVSRADDLVQSCLTRAIAKQHLWRPGTDLRAWLFMILHAPSAPAALQARHGNLLALSAAHY